ncbi:M48 family metalloprotease [Christiangramia portivictoriae]|uniref:M48 family metalloprotease n=1 Tax=Christiangramia portivictoriae TaxID=326069 RepID=UPI000426D405|nr:M48 family metalloprotease [Christiangramia portivictoriae]
MRLGKTLLRLIIGLIIVLFGTFKFCSSSEENPVTGEKQYVGLSAEEEISLGRQSTPKMIEQYQGLHPDSDDQRLVQEVGKKISTNSMASSSPYEFKFYLLADEETVNAFALPGGPIFITYALFKKLEDEDQLAGVLGHEIGHVISRHSAERMAKQGFTNSILTGVAVGSESGGATQTAAVAANLVNMKYGRGDELESDHIGVKIMLEAGYDPEALIGVMKILESSSGSSRLPEFQSTHPNPKNRIEKIKEAIEMYQ